MKLTYKKSIFFIVTVMVALGFLSTRAQEELSMLLDKPVFYLSIEAKKVSFSASINGMNVYTDLDHFGQIALDVPVNHYMHPESNTFAVVVYPTKRGGDFDVSASVSIELRVRPHGVFDKSHRITSIEFDSEGVNSQSDDSHKLSSMSGFSKSDEGDVFVGSLNVSSGPYYKGSLKLSRDLIVPNSLPEWAFFYSDTVPDYYDQELVSDEDYERDLESLLVEYKKVHDAIKKNDIESVMYLFEERNRETDQAFYRNPGETEKIIREDLISSSEDDNLELVDVKASYVSLHPEPNGKVVALKRDSMNSPVVLNFKEGEGSVHYPMYFRKEDGKWILTR
tara:strand:- start:866 stop:1876 length:1011 start_codon:yes stop_codon:yes gene_type:complete